VRFKPKNRRIEDEDEDWVVSASSLLINLVYLFRLNPGWFCGGGSREGWGTGGVGGPPPPTLPYVMIQRYIWV